MNNQLSDKIGNPKVITVALSLIIFILLAIIIFRKPEPVIETTDLTLYQDSLKTIKQEKEQIKGAIILIQNERDSLKVLTYMTQTKYVKIYKFIAVAPINDLDSIIRAAIKE